jgi:hypothetical protein
LLGWESCRPSHLPEIPAERDVRLSSWIADCKAARAMGRRLTPVTGRALAVFDRRA